MQATAPLNSGTPPERVKESSGRRFFVTTGTIVPESVTA
jgi:hypothetical protein